MNLPIVKYGKNERRKFGNINEVIDIPDLVEIQKDSYNTFLPLRTIPITLNCTFSTTSLQTRPNTTKKSAETVTLRMRKRCA